MKFRLSLVRTLLLLVAALVSAQKGVPSTDNRGVTPPSASSDDVPAGYVLGPDDQLTVQVPDVDELSLTINRPPTRVDMKGDINLPLAGSIHAAGLTVSDLEAKIRTRLETFVRSPDVVVTITDFRSQPVSVLGAVNNPGVLQVAGHKSLFEVLSMAGGLDPDAGSTVKITRSLEWGRVPLPGTADDASGRFSIASVDVKRIMAANDPELNIAVKPFDVIMVPSADTVYAVGCVHKPGGFVMGRNRSLSALQVLALAEGLDRFSVPQKAKIIRTVPGTSNRIEIAVNLKKLMSGEGADVVLEPDDVLFVPNSSTKAGAAETADAVLRMATGVVVYGRY